MFNLSFFTARFPSCSLLRLFLLFLHFAVSHTVSFAFVRQTLAAFLDTPLSRPSFLSHCIFFAGLRAHALFRRHFLLCRHSSSFLSFLPHPTLPFPVSRRISSSPPSPPFPLPLLHSSSSPFLVTSKWIPFSPSPPPCLCRFKFKLPWTVLCSSNITRYASPLYWIILISYYRVSSLFSIFFFLLSFFLFHPSRLIVHAFLHSSYLIIRI